MTVGTGDVGRSPSGAVAGSAICLLDPEGRIRTWNRGAEKLFGYPAREAIGRPFETLFPEGDRRSGEPARLIRVTASEGECATDGWWAHRDGSFFCTASVLNAVHDAEGGLVGILVIASGAARRHTAELARLDSERRFGLLVQGVTDYAIFMLDPTGVVTNWNTGARRIKGYAADEIVGRSFSQFYTAADRQAGVPERALQEARDKGRFEAEGWRIRKDGSRFWASVIIDAIRDEDGRLVGFAKVTRDLTERRAAEQAMEDMKEQVHQSQKLEALGQLTGGVAHDFNNLLQVVSSGVSLAESTAPDNERLRKIFLEIKGAVARGSAITRHLLAFSRRAPIKPTVVGVADSIRSARPLIEHALRSNIELVLDLEEGLWPVKVDATQLELALVNVAVNARDAMPQGGRLTIGAGKRHLKGQPDDLRGSFVAITLADTGTGIPPEVLDRIFEPFFTTKPVGVGTGLGLSQVHGFSQQAGGGVTVATKLGEGTEVTLLLPAAGEAGCLLDAEVSEAEGFIPSTARHSLRVLVSDDDAAIARLTVAILDQAGHHATWEPTAQSALDRLASGERFDLVLSDIIMPGSMGGIELGRRIRDRWPNLPVVVTTGYAERAEAFQKEFPMLRKPFSTIELVRMVEAAARRAQGSPDRQRRGE